MRELSIEQKTKVYDPELKKSEDDKIWEEIRDFICWTVDNGCITKYQCERSNFWLVWLEKQRDKKPTWSEEDMAMLDSAIAFVEHSAFTTIGKGKSSVVAWLKSLKDRYTWKPSDEQMEICETPSNSIKKIMPILKFFYQDLEKPMEE